MQYYSESGEDIVIAKILKRLKISKPFYIDIGVHHPIFGNNTYLFYRQGGKGILVEPDQGFSHLSMKKRPRDIAVNAGSGRIDGEFEFSIFPRSTRSTFSKDQAIKWEKASGEKARVEKRPIYSLNTIISKYGEGNEPDIVSIDAEGMDKEILEGFSFSPRPKVFCIELSDGIKEFMEAKGYDMEAKIFQNGIFVDAKLK